MTAQAGWEDARAKLQAGRQVRVVNYHNTPRARADHYRRQFAFYQQRFAPVNEADLELLFATGRWHKDRPGLILSFYNGYRNNHDIAGPLLDEHGLTGWFFVPTSFVATPDQDQAAFAAAHNLRVVPEGEARLAMSWNEVRALAGRHVVASHTRTHARLAEDAPRHELESEILGSQLDLERELGRRVSSYAWLYGGAYQSDGPAAELLNLARYRFLFANHSVHRLPGGSPAGEA